jgi:Cu+-exporting ATPase
MTTVSAPAPPVDREWDRLVAVTGFGVPVLVLAAVPAVQYPYWQWTALALTTPVATWGAWPLYGAALDGLRRGAVGPVTLGALAVAAAFGWSLWALLFGGAGATTHTHPLDLLAPRPAESAQFYLEVAALLVVATLALRRLMSGLPLDEPVDSASPPARTARWATRWYVPGTLCLAGAAVGFWSGADLAATAVSAGLAVLAIAAPLAVELTVPVASAIGLRRAAELGVHIGEGATSAAGSVDVVVLGRALLCTSPVRTSVAVVADTDEADATAVAAALAAHSPDPRATALIDAAAFLPSISGITVDDEGTVRATTGARAVALGRPADLGPDVPEQLGAPDLVIAWDGQVRAGFTVTTDRHPDAPEAVRALRALGLTPVLLTAAPDDVAQALAAGLDIDLVLPDAGPTGKVEVVRRLRSDGHGVVVAAGPGAAHAGAADLPLVVGGAGNGGLGIAPDAPLAAATAVRLARRISGVSEGGLAIALGAALVGLPAAAAGLVHPLLAAAIGPAVTAFVVLNGLRLRRS